MRYLTAPLAAILLSGCVSTAVSVVKAPFQVAGKAVDLATTSPSEADRNYVRKMRKQQEKAAREQRKADEERRWECERYGGQYCYAPSS